MTLIKEYKMIKTLLAIYGAFVIICTILTKKVKNEKNNKLVNVVLKVAKKFSTYKPATTKQRKK